jgi:hypothetical protein
VCFNAGQGLVSSVNKNFQNENDLLIQRQYYEVILFEVQVQVHHEHLFQHLCVTGVGKTTLLLSATFRSYNNIYVHGNFIIRSRKF